MTDPDTRQTSPAGDQTSLLETAIRVAVARRMEHMHICEDCARKLREDGHGKETIVIAAIGDVASCFGLGASELIARYPGLQPWTEEQLEKSMNRVGS